MKRLYKSNQGMISGVCAGIAEYFNIDVTLVRLIAVILMVYTQQTFWVYLIATFIMERRPDNEY